MKENRKTNIIFKIILILLALICMLPMLMVLINSFKTHVDIIKNPLSIGFSAGLSNYVKAWNDGGFARSILNSYCIYRKYGSDRTRVRNACSICDLGKKSTGDDGCT